MKNLSNKMKATLLTPIFLSMPFMIFFLLWCYPFLFCLLILIAAPFIVWSCVYFSLQEKDEESKEDTE